LNLLGFFSGGAKVQIIPVQTLSRSDEAQPFAQADPLRHADLLDRAVEVGGERTKKAAVTKALQELIARREQQRVLKLMGKLEWDPSFDYKTERSR